MCRLWGRLAWKADLPPLVAEPVAKPRAHLGHRLIVKQLHLRRYINHAHFGRCPGASSPTFCLGRHNKTCSDLQSKTRRRALQSDCGAQRLFECARLERRILGVLRRTGACSSALPHTPTRRELFCRRIVGPEMARIGFERNAALEERVFTIAFLSLMDGLKPIHSRRERRVH